MLYAFLIVLIAIIFHNWFGFLPVSSGDLGFFFKEQIIEYFNVPFMWEAFRNSGFGGPSFLHQGVYFYQLPLGILGHVIEYGVIERIIWFYPILIIGFFSSLVLVRVLHLFPSKFYPLTILIYLLNTYFFMIVGGGQLTVVFGYITIPLAFALFVGVLKKITLFKSILFGFVVSLLVLFDFRYAYVFFVVLFLYTIFSWLHGLSQKELIVLGKKYILLFFASFIITVGIHAFWLLPFSLNFQNPSAELSGANTSNDAIKYFSFAKFENSIALLHPLWPENIFGKVGFMKSEFLLLPILAYSSLLFLSSKFKVLASRRSGQNSKLQSKVQSYRSNLTIEQFNNKIIIFFALLGLVGMFLAKGAKEPLGEVYIWMFENIPGFVMFRDPTKWYTLTALSYSILIPYSIYKIFKLLNYHWEKSKITHSTSSGQKSKIQFKIKKYLPNLFLILTISYLLFLIKPAIVGEVGGTLKPVAIPHEYTELKNFIFSKNTFFNQGTFSRILWVPTLQRFTFYSDTHPAISGRDFFNTYEQYGVIAALQKKGTKELLQESGVKYIIVPDDTQKEIYLKDRKFDPVQYKVTLEKLKRISYLEEVNKFGNIIVFEVDNPKDHFWSSSDDLKIAYKFINPTRYSVQVENAKDKDRIIFVESFDRNWVAKIDSNVINSESYEKRFNSFVLPKEGNYNFEVHYKPQELVKGGLIISLFTFFSIASLMIFLAIRGKITG